VSQRVLKFTRCMLVRVFQFALSMIPGVLVRQVVTRMNDPVVLFAQVSGEIER